MPRKYEHRLKRGSELSSLRNMPVVSGKYAGKYATVVSVGLGVGQPRIHERCEAPFGPNWEMRTLNFKELMSEYKDSYTKRQVFFKKQEYIGNYKALTPYHKFSNVMSNLGIQIWPDIAPSEIIAIHKARKENAKKREKKNYVLRRINPETRPNYELELFTITNASAELVKLYDRSASIYNVLPSKYGRMCGYILGERGHWHAVSIPEQLNIYGGYGSWTFPDGTRYTLYPTEFKTLDNAANFLVAVRKI